MVVPLLSVVRLGAAPINGRGRVGPLDRQIGQAGQNRGPHVNQDQIVGNLGNQLHA